MKSWIAAIGLLVVGSIGLYMWINKPDANDNAGAAGWVRPPPVVEVEKVKRGNVVRQVAALGTLRSNESVMLRPEISGRITAFHFDEGAQVQTGNLLIELDDSVYKAEVNAKTADRRIAELAYHRANRLLEKKVASVEGRDTALARLQSEDASLELANAQLRKTQIRAPFGGVIGLRHVSVGDVVSAGQDLVRLVELNPIKVDFRIGEIQLKKISTGQFIDIEVNAFPGQHFRGKVYAIEPQIEVNGRSILIRAQLDNQSMQLRPGLFARVKLIVDEADDALLVSENAIVPSGEQHFVYRLIDGKAVYTEVVLGLRQNTLVEVVQGLSIDDLVITAGQLKLRDGTAVKTVEHTAVSSALPDSAK